MLNIGHMTNERRALRVLTNERRVLPEQSLGRGGGVLEGSGHLDSLHPCVGVQQGEQVIEGAGDPDHEGDVEDGAEDNGDVHGGPHPRQQGAHVAEQVDGGEARVLAQEHLS